MNPKLPGLYIHIPFCVSRCHYCDFYSSTSLSSLPDFLNGLFREMEMYRHTFNPFDTVYIGGGTPSLLRPEQLETLLEKARKVFGIMPESEITVETNPADLDQPFLESMRHAGINRINIGIQSFDEKVLGFLGRRHSVRQAFSAIEASRKAGFRNVGLDLIYGVPGQNLEGWLDSLDQAVVFLPEHISCYQLTLETATPLGRRYATGEFSIPGEEQQREFFLETSRFLNDAGYTHYEVSNFALGSEYTSRHNQKYWDHSPYLGLGPAAHSFQFDQRWWNCRSLAQYLSSVSAGSLPVEGRETLTIEQMQLEALYLGLRTKMGIDLQDFRNRYHADLLTEKKELLVKLKEAELISIQNGHLCPTVAGLAVADRLALI